MDSIADMEAIILDYWKSAASNSLQMETGERAWAEPHVAIAAGDDPLFQRIKSLIGHFHWTPEEAYSLAFPENPAPAAELRVISYILPQTLQTLTDQRRERFMPSERWARSRFHGEAFNCDLRSHLAAMLTSAGYPAVAPERLPAFAYQQSDRFGLASNWSERHAAFVAGHGTFGLSDGLITHRGKAVRFGSVVARIDLPACVKRCPIAAISTEAGHDKNACFTYIREKTAPFVEQKYGTGSTPCGLCQVAIPCELRVPPELSCS